MLQYCCTQVLKNDLEPTITDYLDHTYSINSVLDEIEIVGEVFILSGRSLHTLVPPYNTDCCVVVKRSYGGTKIILFPGSYE